MPDFTLLLGGMDIAPYVRVAPDEGFDPFGGGQFLQPQFTDFPFGEGAALSSVTTANREMSIPMYLNAANNAALNALVARLNNVLRPLVDGTSVSPIICEWKDTGQPSSTYYEVVFGHFESAFSKRHTERGWLAGTLKLQTKPYGHTGTYRSLGTYQATAAPYLRIQAASMLSAAGSLIGDVPADVEVLIVNATSFITYDQRMALVAALPHPSYRAIVNPTMFSAPSSAATTYPYAPGGSEFNVKSSSDKIIKAPLGPGSIMQGDNRVLQFVRSRKNAVVRAIGLDGIDCGPTAMATSGEWTLLDLGVYHIPDWVPTAMLRLSVEHPRDYTLTVWPHAEEGMWDGAGSDYLNGRIELGPALIFPDRNSVMMPETQRRLLTSVAFNQVGTDNQPLQAVTDTYGASYAYLSYPTGYPLFKILNGSYLDMGSFSDAYEDGYYQILAAGSQANPTYGIGVLTYIGSSPNRPFQSRSHPYHYKIEAKFSVPPIPTTPQYKLGVGLGVFDFFATPATATSWAGQASGITFCGIEYVSGPSHAILVKAFDSVVGTIPLIATVSINSADALHIGITWDASSMLVDLRGFHSAIPSALRQNELMFPADDMRFRASPTTMAGLDQYQPVAYIVATSSSNASTPVVGLRSFRVDYNASIGITRGDTYDIYSGDESSRRGDSAFTPVADLAYAQRGGFNGLSVPSAAGGLLVVSVPWDTMTAPIELTTEVRVREKFTYAR